MPQTLLTIAGFDPSGGAGVSLDLAVFRFQGFHGAAVISALTVQNTVGVSCVRPLEPKFVRSQWRSLAADLPFSGVKTGMAGSAANFRVMTDLLGRMSGRPRVVDPVFRSSSGVWLFEREAVGDVLRLLRGRASLVTPNLEEAGRLAGFSVHSPTTMEEAARMIHDRTGAACLVKGGHLETSPVDVLFDGERILSFRKKRLARDVHGTGCFLSAAILAFLAGGKTISEACGLASELIAGSIRSAQQPGRGRFVFGRF